MQKLCNKPLVYFTVFAMLFVILAGSVVFKPVMKQFFPLNYNGYIEKYSNQYNLDKYLVMSMISVESGFDPVAESDKNAMGLMQIQAPTAEWCMEKFGISNSGSDLFDPELNINIGCSYIKYLIDKYNGNTDTALAAYNAGEGNVSRWLKAENSGDGFSLTTIPFEETEKYVRKVNNRLKMHRFIYG